MKKRAVAALSVVVLLTGCSSPEPEQTPTPTPVAVENGVACGSFGSAVYRIPGAVNSDAPAQWDSLRDDFDEIALSASGETQERMMAMVDDWPDFVDVALWNETEPLNDAISAVERSCIADGNTVDFAELTTGQ